MASGDVVVTISNALLVGNVLHFPAHDGRATDPTKDDGSYEIDLSAQQFPSGVNLYTAQVHVTMSAEFAVAGNPSPAPPIPIGQPPFDFNKTYDVVIKEH